MIVKKSIKILPSNPYCDKDTTIKNYYSSWREFNKGNDDSKETFAMIYTSFKDNILPDIEGGALKLYLFFAFNATNSSGDSWYSVEKIADFFKVGSRTVDKWIKILMEKDLIYRDQNDHKSATTYLLPYSTTLMKAKTTGTYPNDTQEIIDDITASLKKQETIFGEILGVFHLFQWGKSRKKLKRNTQWILFITKRSNGILTGHYYELKSSDNYVISKRQFEETYFFESHFNYNNQPLLGIALSNEVDINSNHYSVLKGIIEQLSIINKGDLYPSYFVSYEEVNQEVDDLEIVEED